MRRRKSVGLGAVSFLFCAALVAACSASGNDVGNQGGGGPAADSGAAADTGYGQGPTSDSGSNTNGDSGTVKKDSGVVVVVDSGPPPTSADCDLSGSSVITYFTEAQGGGHGACGASDACKSGDCCMNFATAGSIPPAFALIFSSASPPVCVAQ
ncbi:MAG: hypothetical protein ABI461_07945 [Polyangiaceae bacterium]